MSRCNAGQFDVQDGPASCNDWIRNLAWSHQQDFNHAPRKPVQAGHLATNDWDTSHTVRWRLRCCAVPRLPACANSQGPVVAWLQEYGHLTSVVVRDAGHMVPHDQGEVAVSMVERWVGRALRRRAEAALVQ